MGIASIILGLLSIISFIPFYALPIGHLLGVADSPESIIMFTTQIKKAPILALAGLALGIVGLAVKHKRQVRKVYCYCWPIY
ncbi:MAG: hypothetical protein AB1743_02360 [Actinomycetota bacterium]